MVARDDPADIRRKARAFSGLVRKKTARLHYPRAEIDGHVASPQPRRRPRYLAITRPSSACGLWHSRPPRCRCAREAGARAVSREAPAPRTERAVRLALGTLASKREGGAVSLGAVSDCARLLPGDAGLPRTCRQSGGSRRASRRRWRSPAAARRSLPELLRSSAPAVRSSPAGFRAARAVSD